MNDYELIYLIQEQNEEALKLLYQKYSNVINLFLNQKLFYIKQLNVDSKDIYNYCLINLNNAIRKYDTNSNASFATFASAVIKRAINNYFYDYNFKRFNTLEINSTYIDCYLFDTKKDPLTIISNQEKYNELYQNFCLLLSPFEIKVYNLWLKGFNYQEIAEYLNKKPKQIDNAIQRIKNKIRNYLQ